MKKLIVLVLAVLCVVSVVVFKTSKPIFKDFDEYSNAFVAVRNFILENNSVESDVQQLIVDLDESILYLSQDKVENEETLLSAVKKLSDKDFSYVEVKKDYMIFWDDETGYYGVLWSSNPKPAIKCIVKEARPYMKSRKLSSEWYEVGELDSL